ncbi:hypothetical protein H4582DRAFT_2057452 [Lactarius indigo]|nr:hypothetical protein H4582DRAFT_2057452 [Lactarius indigo]
MRPSHARFVILDSDDPVDLGPEMMPAFLPYADMVSPRLGWASRELPGSVGTFCCARSLEPAPDSSVRNQNRRCAPVIRKLGFTSAAGLRPVMSGCTVKGNRTRWGGARKGSGRRRTQYSTPNLRISDLPITKRPPILVGSRESVMLTVPEKPSQKHTNKYMFVYLEAYKVRVCNDGSEKCRRCVKDIQSGDEGTTPEQMAVSSRYEKYACFVIASSSRTTRPGWPKPDTPRRRGAGCPKEGETFRFLKGYSGMIRRVEASLIDVVVCDRPLHVPLNRTCSGPSTGGGGADNKRNGPSPGVVVAVHVGGCVSRAWGKGGRETRERELARPRAPLVHVNEGTWGKTCLLPSTYTVPATLGLRIKTTDNITEKMRGRTREGGDTEKRFGGGMAVPGCSLSDTAAKRKKVARLGNSESFQEIGSRKLRVMREK